MKPIKLEAPFRWEAPWT